MNKKNQRKYKKITGDFALNFFASSIVTGVLQLIVYPFINYDVGSLAYGEVSTVMGIINTVSATVGLTLNNVRLIWENKYQEKGIEGDFNIILCVFTGAGVIITLIIFLFVFSLTVAQLLQSAVLIVLMSLRQYWMVEYRLYINYKHILYANIFLAVGYLLGCVLMLLDIGCFYVFIIGDLCCLIYVLRTTKIVKEPYRITCFKTNVIKDFFALALTSLAGNLLVYLDRLILYPILGGEAVTTYTIAALGGKYLGIVVSPIAGVLLSYYSQKNFTMTRKRFWIISLGGIIVSVFSLVVIIPLAPVIAKILYPTAYESALEYMVLASIAGIIGTMAVLIQPAVLRYAPSICQIIKTGTYGVAYIGGGLFFLEAYGLMGFCIANIIANILKVIILLFMGHMYCSDNREEK